MVVEGENSNTEEGRSEFPEVPDEAIVNLKTKDLQNCLRHLKKNYQEMKINTRTKV